MPAVVQGAVFNPATESIPRSSCIQVFPDPTPISQGLAPHTPARADNSHQPHPQATHPTLPVPAEQPGGFTPNFLGSTTGWLQNPLSDNQELGVASGKFPGFSLPETPFAAIVQTSTKARRPALHQRFSFIITTAAGREFSWNSGRGRVQVLL